MAFETGVLIDVRIAEESSYGVPGRAAQHQDASGHQCQLPRRRESHRGPDGLLGGSGSAL